MKPFIAILLAPLLFQSSCYEKCAFEINQLPTPIFFVIKENGNRLEDRTLDSLKMFFYESGHKKFTDLSRSVNVGPYLFHDWGIQDTRDAIFISGDQKIKTFYLEYPGGDQDTLYIDYRRLSDPDDACEHLCKCEYPFESLLFNSKAPIVDSSIQVHLVYIFNKN